MSDNETPEWAHRAATDLIGKPYPYDANMVVVDAKAQVHDETRVVIDLTLSPVLRTVHQHIAIDHDEEFSLGFTKIVRVPEGEPVECAWCESRIPPGVFAFFNPDATEDPHGPWAELGHRTSPIPAPKPEEGGD